MPLSLCPTLSDLRYQIRARNDSQWTFAGTSQKDSLTISLYWYAFSDFRALLVPFTSAYRSRGYGLQLLSRVGVVLLVPQESRSSADVLLKIEDLVLP